jgi:hypothetical protein
MDWRMPSRSWPGGITGRVVLAAWSVWKTSQARCEADQVRHVEDRGERGASGTGRGAHRSDSNRRGRRVPPNPGLFSSRQGGGQ